MDVPLTQAVVLGAALGVAQYFPGRVELEDTVLIATRIRVVPLHESPIGSLQLRCTGGTGHAQHPVRIRGGLGARQKQRASLIILAPGSTTRRPGTATTKSVHTVQTQRVQEKAPGSKADRSTAAPKVPAQHCAPTTAQSKAKHQRPGCNPGDFAGSTEVRRKVSNKGACNAATATAATKSSSIKFQAPLQERVRQDIPIQQSGDQGIKQR